MEVAAPIDNPLDKLNARQRRFVLEYMDCLNGSEAARRAGYAKNRANQSARQLLTNSDIKAAISYLGEQMGMSAGEAVRRLSEMARGTLIPFVRYYDRIVNNPLTGDPLIVAETGLPLMVPCVEIGLETNEAKANLHLLKKIKQGQYGLEIELNDPKDALDKILQLHGRYKQLPGDLGDKESKQAYQLPDGTVIIF